MKNKKMIMRAVRTVLCALTALAGPVLYFCLVNKGVGDSMMYSAKSPVFVIALSALGAVGVFIILKLPLFEEVPEQTDFEEYEEEDTRAEVWTPEQDTNEARELYPELFRDGPEPEEEEEKPKISSAYYDAMTSAINSQKAEVVIEDGETECEEDDILKIEKAEDALPDIYADLPETLPEGYTPYFEQEEPEDEVEEEESEEGPQKNLAFRIAKRVAVIILFLALSVAFCTVSALSYTVYTSDGFTVHTMFSKESYSWQDCKEYEIAPSFFGDRIDVTLYMKDGQKISLLPSDAVFREAFYEKYDSIYEYALHAANVMTDLGAKKHVKEKNTIESNFCSREDIGEYIEKLID